MTGLLFPLLFVTSVSTATLITGQPQVSDGDTLRLGPVTLRLHGIDAPETGQRCTAAEGGSWDCGVEATRHLKALIAGREISCVALEEDRYGRIIARCEADGEDLGAAMVASGMVWAYRSYSTAYIAEEARARQAGIGIWITDTQPAWEFRTERWSLANQETPLEECPIKGNISAKGERIYHTPWSPVYAKTVIREDQGERWFCDEAEALAAGWRPARWK